MNERWRGCGDSSIAALVQQVNTTGTFACVWLDDYFCLLTHVPSERARPRQGFTLIELLVVMAIIVVMIALGARVINSMTGNQSLGQINSTVADILNDARTQAAVAEHVLLGRILERCARWQFETHRCGGGKCDGPGKRSDGYVPPALKVVMAARSFRRREHRDENFAVAGP